MESMEPISAHYTTSYPEIQPDSGYQSRETTDSLARTPAAPVYDEELVHKVWSKTARLGCLFLSLINFKRLLMKQNSSITYQTHVFYFILVVSGDKLTVLKVND